jgi:hypothetical protein
MSLGEDVDVFEMPEDFAKLFGEQIVSMPTDGDFLDTFMGTCAISTVSAWLLLASS